jgi:hypothetical protein
LPRRKKGFKNFYAALLPLTSLANVNRSRHLVAENKEICDDLMSEKL